MQHSTMPTRAAPPKAGARKLTATLPGARYGGAQARTAPHAPHPKCSGPCHRAASDSGLQVERRPATPKAPHQGTTRVATRRPCLSDLLASCGVAGLTGAPLSMWQPPPLQDHRPLNPSDLPGNPILTAGNPIHIETRLPRTSPGGETSAARVTTLWRRSDFAPGFAKSCAELLMARRHAQAWPLPCGDMQRPEHNAADETTPSLGRPSAKALARTTHTHNPDVESTRMLR